MKYFVLILLFLFTANTVKSQNHYLNFGVKAGLNISALKSTSSATYNELYLPLYSFHLGCLSTLRLNNHCSLQAELSISQQGAKSREPGIAANPAILQGSNPHLLFLNFPLLFQLHYGQKLWIEAGPQAGMLLSVKTVDNLNNYDQKQGFSKFDFSLVLGMIYKVSPGIGIDARFNLGASQASRLTADVFQRVFQIGAFYIFSKKGFRHAL